MVSSNSVVCGSKISRFIKGQDAGGLLSSLGIKKSLDKVLLIGPILF